MRHFRFAVGNIICLLEQRYATRQHRLAIIVYSARFHPPEEDLRNSQDGKYAGDDYPRHPGIFIQAQ
ncbi:hypothetical protein [Cronobacter dublinensis]|uniref:hypothetical protein n=1 Tax=Cronobacter dublinensis TaxID=413497 RepID=UPI001F35E941|nr:hypothetical protein [Cronobacter dublinensis]